MKISGGLGRRRPAECRLDGITDSAGGGSPSRRPGPGQPTAVDTRGAPDIPTHSLQNSQSVLLTPVIPPPRALSMTNGKERNKHGLGPLCFLLSSIPGLEECRYNSGLSRIPALALE